MFGSLLLLLLLGLLLLDLLLQLLLQLLLLALLQLLLLSTSSLFTPLSVCGKTVPAEIPAIHSSPEKNRYNQG